jgi:hypothetical protein
MALHSSERFSTMIGICTTDKLLLYTAIIGFSVSLPMHTLSYIAKTFRLFP